MLYWIIQITVISIIFIFLIHNLIHFFKSTLTVPKIKDLVNTPTQKYEDMFNIISNKNNYNSNTSFTSEYSLSELLPSTNINTNSTNINTNSTNINTNSTNNETTMKSELKNFLKKQLNNSNDSSTEISTLDSMTGNNSYSTFN